MNAALIIVESPAKARTISRLLGKDYVVESSIGHIRDLPSKTAEIPPAHRKKPWARTGVDIDNGFKPLYVIPPAKKKQVSKLKDLLADASVLLLGTDEDREGEAIAWHLKEVLKPKIPVKRMVFHEITERAVKEALDNPRDLDRRLVDAQEGRRILDRLFGYEVSPVLWRKVRPRLSAGRVQSVATRLVVGRERQRRAFRSGDYWSVAAELRPLDLADDATGPRALRAELQELAGRRIAVGRHFDPATGQLSQAAKRDGVLLLDEQAARALERGLEAKTFDVVEVQQKRFTQRPQPPFITSTLQQEAGRKLGYTAQRTMRTAQRLYESGYITYMRTDSTTLSEQAVTAARGAARSLYGEEYLPDKPRVYAKKVRGAQEAHEAIRPAGDQFRTPERLRDDLDRDAFRLYQLIWKRTVACQMRDAVGQRTQVRIRSRVDEALAAEADEPIAGDAMFSASGKVIVFAGYLRAYVQGSDDPEAELEDRERLLPPLSEKDRLLGEQLSARGHSTQPPARYTEASLVKELEDRGIGRPSTYAAIIQTIQDRGYVWKQGSALIPTLTAFAVTNLLESHFEDLVDYEFTAKMESDLDEISSGDKDLKPWLERFYFGEKGRDGSPTGPAGTAPRSTDGKQGAKPTAGERGNGTKAAPSLREAGLRGLIGTGVEDIDAREVCSMEIGETPGGETINARVGRYGPYLQVGDSDRRANIADDVPLDELDGQRAMKLLREADMANRVLGVDPESGKNVYIKTGSYGPYVQLGEPELTPKGNIKKGGKPKMASLWPGMSVETITLEQALMLLSYPRVVGQHPETGADITVQDGKFGPYLQTEADGKRETRSLEGYDDLANIDLARALELLSQPRKSRRSTSNTVISELAESPVTEKPIQVRNGRFGPYVTDGQVNATIPSHRDPQKITFDEALELIAAREQRMRDQGKDPRAPKKGRSGGRSASAKSSTKKAAKKSSSKKKAAKKSSSKKKAAKKGTSKRSQKKSSPKKTDSKKAAAK